MSEIDEDEEIEDDPRIARWAKWHATELGMVSEMINAARDRAGVHQELRDTIELMREAFDGAKRGSFGSDYWKLELKLETDSEDSKGTRIYEVSFGDDGVRIQCYGSEWQRGVGSDSWQGKECVLAPPYPGEGTDSLVYLMEEWNDAIRDSNYELIIKLNEDALCYLPSEGAAPHENRAVLYGALRSAVSRLQELKAESCNGAVADSLSAWDVVCTRIGGGKKEQTKDYMEVMSEVLSDVAANLSAESKRLLWLMTKEGEAWVCNHSLRSEIVPVALPDIVDYLRAELLDLAARYDSLRLRAYERESANDS